MFVMKCGAQSVLATQTSAALAATVGADQIESLSIYPTGGSVQITWGSGHVSTITADMKGHTFVAMNGTKGAQIDTFVIDTDCDVAFTAF